MSVLQRQLKNQIYSLYDADTTGFKSSINGLYFYLPPKNITQDNYPIVTYRILTTSFDYTFDGGQTPKMEDVLVQFNILSKEEVSTEAENILEKLEGVYDGASLSLTGWSRLEMSRDAIIGPYKDDQLIWNVNVRYRILCEKA